MTVRSAHRLLQSAATHYSPGESEALRLRAQRRLRQIDSPRAVSVALAMRLGTGSRTARLVEVGRG